MITAVEILRRYNQEPNGGKSLAQIIEEGLHEARKEEASPPNIVIVVKDKKPISIYSDTRLSLDCIEFSKYDSEDEHERKDDYLNSTEFQKSYPHRVAR